MPYGWSLSALCSLTVAALPVAHRHVATGCQSLSLIGGSRRTETATLAGPTPPRIIGVVAWYCYLQIYSKGTKKMLFSTIKFIRNKARL